MKQSFARTFILAGAILGAAVAPAAAQDVPPRSDRSLVPAEFPRWDATGSLGLLVVSTADTGVSWDSWEQKADYRLDVGRYWTTHLKTEVAFSTSNPTLDYDTVRLVVPGVAAAYAYDEIDRQLYTVAPALTWQFFENNFVHPYVSGGVKIGILQERRHRLATTQRSGAISYSVPAVDERRTLLLARPFVAGGFKSYISRSVFVRTEARVAFTQDGVRQVSMMAGAGVIL